jgi:hypothetical protein
MGDVPRALAKLIDGYRSHSEEGQFAERSCDEAIFELELDRTAEFQCIQTYLADHLDDREITMAVAFALRFRFAGEDESDATAMINVLMSSPFSRTRYRAAQSAAYRARTGSPDRVIGALKAGVRAALVDEDCDAVLLALCDAFRTLHSNVRIERLDETEQRIWDCLKGHIKSVKEICIVLGLSLDEKDQAFVRKKIERMKKRGFAIVRKKEGGYWREDAPHSPQM